MEDHVVVVPYDQAWPAEFGRESRAIAEALGGELRSEHVGSTAIAGMAAKPTIDVMIGASQPGVDARIIAAFEKLGYAHLGEYGIPEREFFRKGQPPTHHVHWVKRGGAFWNDQILFRDFMRNHPAECEAYESLKLDLAQHFSHNRKSYTSSKSSLIMALMQRARESSGVRRIVVDLEATCWEIATTVQRQEIIEIGAVELGVDLKAGREFSRFVRPTKEPVLSEFCLQLTNIPQAAVDAAKPFPEIFAEFVDWIGPAPYELCSWGRYDIEQFGADCARHGLSVPDGFAKYIDLRDLFSRRHGVAPGPMTEALSRMKLVFEGTRHRGIDDARNAGRLARVLLA